MGKFGVFIDVSDRGERCRWQFYRWADSRDEIELWLLTLLLKDGQLRKEDVIPSWKTYADCEILRMLFRGIDDDKHIIHQVRVEHRPMVMRLT